MSGLIRYLRPALLADAASSGAMGILLATAAEPLAPFLGLPAGLLRTAGLGLLPFAALVAYAGTRSEIAPPLVWTIVVVNALWVTGGLVLLASPGLAPTGLGQLFVLAQAATVGALALVQALALRELSGARFAA